MSEASLWVRTSGPLAVHADGLAKELARQGYAERTAQDHLRLMAHLSGWMASQALVSMDLTAERCNQFLQARRDAGYTHGLSRRSLEPLLGYLRELELAPSIPEPDRTTSVECVLALYQSYLVGERGLAVTTVGYYVAAARLFLSEHADSNGNDLEGLMPAEVRQFVLRQGRQRGPGAAKVLIPALRSLLRFLYLEGRTETSLAKAVPSVASWRGAALPRALDPQHVTGLLANCNRRKASGRRDYAILTLMVRLGLRAGEVAALELGDVDWRRGELMIRGKGRRQERLPLPVDVGEALTEYLRHSRRLDVKCRKLFLSVVAPIGGLTRAGVKDIVYHACDRACLPRVGAHRLRHSAATELLRRGAPLAEIAQVLRHRSLLTTAIYAKVDHASLRTVALPWPGAEA